MDAILPSCSDVGVQILFRRAAATGAVSRVIIGEYVTIEPRSESIVEAAHLTKVDRIAMREKNCVFGRVGASHEQASDLMPAFGTSQEALKPL